MTTEDDTFAVDLQDAIRYINGASDDTAEDAYFTIETLALESVDRGMRILESVVAGIEPSAFGSFGAGLFETFLRAKGAEAPAEIDEAIKGNSRLLRALVYVNEYAVPHELAILLAPLL